MAALESERKRLYESAQAKQWSSIGPAKTSPPVIAPRPKLASSAAASEPPSSSSVKKLLTRNKTVPDKESGCTSKAPVIGSSAAGQDSISAPPASDATKVDAELGPVLVLNSAPGAAIS